MVARTKPPMTSKAQAQGSNEAYGCPPQPRSLEDELAEGSPCERLRSVPVAATPIDSSEGSASEPELSASIPGRELESESGAGSLRTSVSWRRSSMSSMKSTACLLVLNEKEGLPPELATTGLHALDQHCQRQCQKLRCLHCSSKAGLTCSPVQAKESAPAAGGVASNRTSPGGG